MMAFFFFFSSVLIFYWESLTFLKYINTLSLYLILMWVATSEVLNNTCCIFTDEWKK